eukprot:TRINITY_DN16933_c0_g1_i1.p1 TRINITY_DN16933_c0_g1~~TRINITY_DN16933_c0_g1_i1.p1  ORF type:complete len:124 (+),score=9.38 TRINITY_DN16933_c0_g1_i1:527-898(+)
MDFVLSEFAHDLLISVLALGVERQDLHVLAQHPVEVVGRLPSLAHELLREAWPTSHHPVHFRDVLPRISSNIRAPVPLLFELDRSLHRGLQLGLPHELLELSHSALAVQQGFLQPLQLPLPAD